MTTKTSVTIKQITKPDDLFCRYPGQSDPQPCDLYLDIRNGELSCEYNPNIGSGTTMAHYHGLILETRIPCLTADAANRLLEEVAPLAQRVLDGARKEWDGNNNVGILAVDAQAAWDEITDQCDPENFEEHETVSEWCVSDWFTEGDESTIDTLGIDGDTSDDELASMASEQVEQVKAATSAGYGVLDYDDTLAYLTALREQVRDAARAELEDVAEQINELTERRDELIRQQLTWKDPTRAIGERADLSHVAVQKIGRREPASEVGS